jgi:hypothetical protein
MSKRREPDGGAAVPREKSPALAETFVALYAINEDGLCAGAYRVPWSHFSREDRRELLAIFNDPGASSTVSFVTREENLFFWRLGKRLHWWTNDNFPDQDAETRKLVSDLVQFKVTSPIIAGPLMGSIAGLCCS